MSERMFTQEDMAAAWELGWASARDNYTALYTGKEIPETVTLRNPFGNYNKTLWKVKAADDDV